MKPADADRDSIEEIDQEAARVRAEYGRRAADPRLQSYYSRVDKAFARQREARYSLIANALSEVGPPSSMRVVDVGCGTGIYLKDLRQRGFHAENLAGVDLLPSDIAAAKSLMPDVTLMVGNAVRLPFPDASFDAAIFVTVLSSIVDDRVRSLAAREAARIVREGGIILSYDLRRVTDGNPHLRPIHERELARLFGEVGTTTSARHGLSLAIDSRVPERVGGVLSRIPALLDFILAVTVVGQIALGGPE